MGLSHHPLWVCSFSGPGGLHLVLRRIGIRADPAPSSPSSKYTVAILCIPGSLSSQSYFEALTTLASSWTFSQVVWLLTVSCWGRRAQGRVCKSAIDCFLSSTPHTRRAHVRWPLVKWLLSRQVGIWKEISKPLYSARNHRQTLVVSNVVLKRTARFSICTFDLNFA